MSVASIINGNLTLGKLSFTDGTSQTTAGDSILTTSNNFTNSNNFVCGDGFASPNFTVGQKGNYGLEISFDTIPDEGAVSLLSNGQGGSGGFNFFTQNIIGEARSNILKVGNGGITLPNENQGILFQSSTTTQTYPYVPNTTLKKYTINASTSTVSTNPASLNGYTACELDATYTLTGNVYLSLPAGYKNEKFLLLNRNLTSTYSIYITIGQTDDRITYFNSTDNNINQCSSTSNYLVITQEPSTSPSGFAYVFDAILNPANPSSIQWLVSTITLASLNIVAT